MIWLTTGRHGHAHGSSRSARAGAGFGPPLWIARVVRQQTPVADCSSTRPQPQGWSGTSRHFFFLFARPLFLARCVEAHLELFALGLVRRQGCFVPVGLAVQAHGKHHDADRTRTA